MRLHFFSAALVAQQRGTHLCMTAGNVPSARVFIPRLRKISRLHRGWQLVKCASGIKTNLAESECSDVQPKRAKIASPKRDCWI